MDKLRCWQWPVVVLTIICLLTGAACKRNRMTVAPTVEALPPVSDITAEAEAWADSVLQTLTLRQKIAQMIMPAVYSLDDYWTLRQVAEYADSCMGGVVLLKGSADGARAISDTLQSRGKAAPFIAIDAEWGLAMRLADAPEFPANSEISPDADEGIMYDYGYELARECRAVGINMVLGPVVDVTAAKGFIGRRSLGSDPQRVADLAIAYARGLEDGNVMSVAKHFPGHGSVGEDSHTSKPIIPLSLHQLDSVDLYPFKKWVDNDLSAVMVGHLAVPSIDSRMLPAAVSPTVITELLRRDLGFKGLVLTDALNMKGAEGHTAVDALLAGADMVVAPASAYAEIDRVEKAVEETRISPTAVEDRVKRILFYKFLFARTVGRGDMPQTLQSVKSDSIASTLRYQLKPQ